MNQQSVAPTSHNPRCPHGDADYLSEVCAHLLDHRDDASSNRRDYFRCFTGHKLERKLICKACGEKGANMSPFSAWICDECLSEVEENGMCVGYWGVPGIQTRDVSLRLYSTDVPSLPDGSRIAKVTPLLLEAGSQWLILSERSELWRAEFTTGSIRRVVGMAELGLPVDQELSLVSSRNGEFAVVALTFGRTGVVIETCSGRVLMSLDRGNYHNQQCRFPAAFCEHNGQTLLVHPTNWNRLDVSDPRSGRLLTHRSPTSYSKDKQRPEHYLDYFHCDLRVSRNDQWIADNGWAWHPFGVVRTWNLRDWLTRNVWESEDGPSIRGDIGRASNWDGPFCWASATELAVWGVGDDDYTLLPGVRLLDVTNGQERPPLVGSFGPSSAATTPESAAANHQLAKDGVLEFDGCLFAWSPAAGLTAWDLADGARVFEDVDFCPFAYNRATREFFSQDAEGNCRLSKLTSS